MFGNEVRPSNKGKRFQSCEVEDGHWLASHLVLIKTVKLTDAGVLRVQCKARKLD